MSRGRTDGAGLGHDLGKDHTFVFSGSRHLGNGGVRFVVDLSAFEEFIFCGTGFWQPNCPFRIPHGPPWVCWFLGVGVEDGDAVGTAPATQRPLHIPQTRSCSCGGMLSSVRPWWLLCAPSQSSCWLPSTIATTTMANMMKAAEMPAASGWSRWQPQVSCCTGSPCCHQPLW